MAKMKRSTAKTRRQKAGLALVAAFDEAAQRWGWESDQGTGQRVVQAEADYNRTRAALEDYIRRNVS